ncbi:3-demethylubiquinone-9 3-methyltransferase [Ruegeria denitrificans]|uniref:3-demethylubiquinone-9 3-methyltransferase n=1 Tax=Ruegeria denitrificans TaxID=1715692 RepID=A0A0P1IAP6_9RHOB|nr:methyltransferase domain-containing protein [Ruegeria denitrificans]CUK01961.1 3-demethylubiquinone-9 3-methyltransferase [Ruegeria denitrificans]
MADIFQALDQLDRESVQKIADRLEFRGTFPPFVAMRERYFDRLQLEQRRNVLDMGCGTGVVTRALAARLPSSATLTGSDFSADFIEFARQYAAAEGLQDRLSFELADSHATKESADKFDLVVLHTLVSHVVDPSQVLKEAARLTSPGGRIAVFDGDYASITFGAGDPALNEIALQGLLKTVVANPHVMRQFPEIIAGTGLEVVDFLPEILAEAGEAEFFKSMLDSYSGAMVAAGHLDQDSAQRWSATHLDASERGTFFGSCNFMTYVLRKA